MTRAFRNVTPRFRNLTRSLRRSQTCSQAGAHRVLRERCGESDAAENDPSIPVPTNPAACR